MQGRRERNHTAPSFLSRLPCNPSTLISFPSNRPAVKEHVATRPVLEDELPSADATPCLAPWTVRGSRSGWWGAGRTPLVPARRAVWVSPASPLCISLRIPASPTDAGQSVRQRPNNKYGAVRRRCQKRGSALKSHTGRLHGDDPLWGGLEIFIEASFSGEIVEDHSAAPADGYQD
jgi:hypothetical protein